MRFTDTNKVNKNQYSLMKWPSKTEISIKLPAMSLMELFTFIILKDKGLIISKLWE
jgi:hypothetical protein|tara:strand:+ start:158219 stop:158386 length:168 start_codon:yes stop_codon:yes gene_type:complete